MFSLVFVCDLNEEKQFYSVTCLLSEWSYGFYVNEKSSIRSPLNKLLNGQT